LASNGHVNTGFDVSVPNVARIYDYLLGGKDNYALDRKTAEELLVAVPDAAIAARQNRQFLGRAVRFLADSGIRQFIDIGTGLPTQGNVHEIAQQVAPDARVCYVDNDSVVVAHAQALLVKDANTAAIGRDLRDPEQIISDPDLRALIDLDKPVAILLVAILHFIADVEKPHAIVDRLKEAMTPGSYLVISHVTGDGISAEAAERARQLYENSSAPGVTRTRAEITCFFDGVELIPPGVVNVSSWKASRPARRSGQAIFCAGVGQKPPRKAEAPESGTPPLPIQQAGKWPG
jgi:hypothetical protein